jgi:hypothetical protein
MACLSWQRDGVGSFIVAANPIFLLSELIPPVRGVIEYEILEADAELLEAHVGTSHKFYIDEGSGTFLAKIGPLRPVEGTHPGLSLLGDRTILRGSLDVIDPSAAA